MFRIFPVKKKKIVFCCIEGSTGYSCNPKYIAEELIRRKTECELIWLVNDITKQFPREVRGVRNTLMNRAYHLTTAKIWIDNSRKQLEVRKRKGQCYIQTWHAKLGFKPTCLDRGKSFTRIAYLISHHDSQMIDYVLSNSKWYDDTLPTGMLYKGEILRFGSPRCDILVNGLERVRAGLRKTYGLPKNAHIIMYAPTFRGGSQKTQRTIQLNQETLDYAGLLKALSSRFQGHWYIMLRFHPQLVARQMHSEVNVTCNDSIIDVSRADDMYEILAGCDAFLTDYSSAAFDAAVMKIPIFIYADDYKNYQSERGNLLWDLDKLPFGVAYNNESLQKAIKSFEEDQYQQKLLKLFKETEMKEDGRASARVVDFIYSRVKDGEQISIRNR
ncbi:MAG: CDP-glycerol glycerophosphotransferase family protein [Ruminococcus sp.]|nr:CDP-glycerol glycerophosphotransferase family protein [Ruminococcus sp.]